MRMYAPVFRKDGMEFIFGLPVFLDISPEGAKQIGIGAMFVEAVLVGATNTYRVLGISSSSGEEPFIPDKPLTDGKLGDYPVFVIGEIE